MTEPRKRRRRIVIAAVAVVAVLAVAGLAWWAWSAGSGEQTDGAAPVTAEPTPSPEEPSDEAIEEAFSDYLDDCTAPADSVPEHCGMRVPWAADLASLERIEFEVEKAPSLATNPDAHRFVASGGVLTATATGTTDEGETASFTYRTDAWTLRGAIEDDGEQVVLSVR